MTIAGSRTRLASDDSAVLACENISVRYRVPRGVLGHETVYAVENVSLQIQPGQIVGLVGESGCGKSTLARVLAGLQRATSGILRYRGTDVSTLSDHQRRRGMARQVSIVFQDPSSSLNPRWPIRDVIRDPLEVHGLGTRAQRDLRVRELLDLVGVPSSAAERLPSQLSGGQRQRVAIARALALEPALVVADEPTSSLDVSVKSQILNLLADLRAQLGLAMVLISHDIQAVRYLSDRIVVMYLGRVVEDGPTAHVGQHHQHPYTHALFSAVPSLQHSTDDRVVLTGTVPSPRNPPSGCPFRTRCWQADDSCAVSFPSRRGDDHGVHCVRPLSANDGGNS